jgi:hypothetical protein
MIFSFLYRSFCPVLLLVRLTCRSREVAVLRHQAHRPMLRPADESGSWRGWYDCSPTGVSGTSSSSRRPCCAGTVGPLQALDLFARPSWSMGHAEGNHRGGQ